MTQAINASGWPILRGIQTVKEVSYLNMRQASAAAQLSKLWSDTFLTNAGIYAAGSSGYTYRGSANFDVIKATGTTQHPPSDMTNDTTPAPYVASASANSANAYKAFEAAAAAFQAGAALPGWVKLDLGSAKVITSYKLNGYGVYSPKDFVLEGSNDNTNWTLLDTQTGVTSTHNAEATFTFTNTVAYRYYRLTSTKTYVDDTADLGINWLWLIEPAPASASIVSVLALDLAANITQVMMFADVTLGTGTAAYYASTDDGSTWTAVTPETLATVPAGKKIRIKVVLTGDAELESWGVAV